MIQRSTSAPCERPVRTTATALVGESQRVPREVFEAFVCDVSHDLHAPLRTIRSFGELLRQTAEARLSDDERELLQGMTQAAARMEQLLNGLRRFACSTTTAEMTEEVECEAALQAALQNLQSLISEQRATITHGPLPCVRGRGMQIVQVFQNLIANAIQYRSPRPLRIHVRAVLTGDTWTIEVRDNGIGIDPRQGERIFQIFQRLSSQAPDEHSGIGLAICQRIVQGHGGRIWVSSTPGHGSRFFFTLPRSSAEGTEPLTTASSPQGAATRPIDQPPRRQGT